MDTTDIPPTSLSEKIPNVGSPPPPPPSSFTHPLPVPRTARFALGEHDLLGESGGLGMSTWVQGE